MDPEFALSPGQTLRSLRPIERENEARALTKEKQMTLPALHRAVLVQQRRHPAHIIRYAVLQLDADVDPLSDIDDYIARPRTALGTD